MVEATMVLSPENSSDEDLLGVVRDWVELLAVNDFESGCAMLHHYPDEVWTPDFLRMWISNYGWHDPVGDGSIFRVTSCKTAVERGNRIQSVERRDLIAADSTVGDVEFDLPLNGEWSGLTAIFSLLRRGEFLALRLDDVHVL